MQTSINRHRNGSANLKNQNGMQTDKRNAIKLHSTFICNRRKTITIQICQRIQKKIFVVNSIAKRHPGSKYSGCHMIHLNENFK